MSDEDRPDALEPETGSDWVPGLTITDVRLDQVTERNIILLQRGLDLHEAFSDAAEDQEVVRNAAVEAVKARGETPTYADTEEEKAWEAYNDRALAGIAFHHRDLLDQFSLDPRRSVLFGEFPQLLYAACDPQTPVLYDPALRRFALIETWGPAVRSFTHCLYTGQALPLDLSDEWFDLIDELMGTDEWTSSEARNRLGVEYFSEAWWVKRGF